MKEPWRSLTNGLRPNFLLARGENEFGTRVPQRNGGRIGLVVFVIENTERRGAEQKMLRFADGQSDPARGKDATEVTMRKERDVSFQRAEFRDEAVSTGA